MDAKQAELLRRVASVVGHELRNPMAVINNSAYFIQAKLSQEKGLDPKVAKHLGIVASEIARADKLIGEILIYSRPLEAKPVVRPLAPLIEAGLAGLPDSVKLDKKLPAKIEAAADEKLFAGAVARLAQNAADAMPEGGKLAVELSLKKGEACLELRDSGPGLAAEAQARLFEPFNTTKPRGLGLGLAMVQKIMEAHKGRVEGGSSKSGTVFKLFLPA